MCQRNSNESILSKSFLLQSLQIYLIFFLLFKPFTFQHRYKHPPPIPVGYIVSIKYAHIKRLKEMCKIRRQREKLDVVLTAKIKDFMRKVAFTAIHKKQPLLTWIIRSGIFFEVFDHLIAIISLIYPFGLVVIVVPSRRSFVTHRT